jgi:hypothetical protein
VIHTNTSLKGVYQDVQLRGLSSTPVSSSESEKENLIQYAVTYLEERFLRQGNIGRFLIILPGQLEALWNIFVSVRY